MDFQDLERILELVRQHELAEFELEHEGLKLRVRKAGAGTVYAVAPQLTAATTPVAAVVPQQIVPVNATAAGNSVATGELVEETELELAVVKSPIVGTFYSSPEPGTAPFVDIGDRVKKDQVLCIIEAMKLMNEITSEYEGEVVSVYVENGKPVQYGERLFAIRTA